MEFKKWLALNEIGDNYGADLPLHRPEKLLMHQAKQGVGAMPVANDEPLPGNKKMQKKKMKKGSKK